MTDLITKARDGRAAALRARAASGEPVGTARLRLAAWSDVPAFASIHRTPLNIFAV